MRIDCAPSYGILLSDAVRQRAIRWHRSDGSRQRGRLYAAAPADEDLEPDSFLLLLGLLLVQQLLERAYIQLDGGKSDAVLDLPVCHHWPRLFVPQSVLNL